MSSAGRWTAARSDLLLVAGVVALCLAAVALVIPSVVTTGIDRFVLILVGLAAGVQAYRVATRRRGSVNEVDLGSPEFGVPVSVPGDDVETILGQFHGHGRIYFHRGRVRAALRRAAIDVLTTDGGYSASAARTAVDDGSWTTDPSVANFLGDDDVPPPPRSRLLSDRFARRSRTRIDLERTVDALADIAGIDTETGQSLETGSDRPVSGDDGRPLTRAAASTGHWRGVGTIALVGIGAGVLLERPALLLIAVVGVAFVAYARSGLLGLGSVSIRRSLESTAPEPGETVAVTVAVTNESGRFLPDVRVADGVPPALTVDEGSPRYGTALRAGETRTFDYTVTASRGDHRFDPTRIVTRDLPGATERLRACFDETALVCRPRLRAMDVPVPLRGARAAAVGPVPTDRGGTGVEFHATREYRPGDALARIDWHRRARTGELATREFREERAATVVLAIDARPGGFVSPGPETPHAVDRAVDAAGRFAATLLDAGNRVGLTAVHAAECWLEPGTGADHRARLREMVSTHEALSSVPTETTVSVPAWTRDCRRRLPDGAQVILLTPLVDDGARQLATAFETHGHRVTVCSPDPTARRTSGHRLAAIARQHRVTALREAGIPVVDWPADVSLETSCARHAERRGP